MTKFTSKIQMQLPVKSISAQQLRQIPNTRYFKIYEKDAVLKPLFPYEEKGTNRHVKFEESFVLEVPNSIIVGLDGYVVFEGKQVIEETTRRWHHYSDHKLFQNGVISEVETIEKTVAVIAASASQCFTHWMLHILPRLKLLMESGLTYDYLYVPKLTYAFQKDTLEFIGIDNSKLIEAENDTVIKANKVIVPSLIYGVAAVRPSWACQFVKDTFLPTNERKSTTKRRLYISRKISTTKGYRRYVVNEKEVLFYLESLGFEQVIMEDYSVVRQAKLFSESEIIVAAHGAALTNVIFCKPGTKVFEIFMQRHLCESYFCIGMQSQLDHHCLLSADELLTEEQRKIGDIHIPLDELKNKLDIPTVEI
ncbi:glycosyltransferase family 61 protein [Ekhidna sp.]|uniref:glycosyltransferase family 61 protein n=1 Tax=Ekhidna sp. TaxID=2608089 RepID=UPI003297108C